MYDIKYDYYNIEKLNGM